MNTERSKNKPLPETAAQDNAKTRNVDSNLEIRKRLASLLQTVADDAFNLVPSGMIIKKCILEIEILRLKSVSRDCL